MEQILINPDRCLSCHSCELACAVEHSFSKELFAAVLGKERTKPRIFVETDGEINLPLQCRHCQEPMCVNACMTGALSKDATTGKVLFNQDKCVGCWMCVMTCPFGTIEQDMSEKIISKCDRCPDREQPACANACPTGAIRYTKVADFAHDQRKHYLTNFTNS